MRKILLLAFMVILVSCHENQKQDIPAIVEDGKSVEKEISNSKKDSDYKYEVIPGKKLGSITINQNASPVLDSLGKPDSGDAAMGKAVATWHENSENLLELYTTTQMGIEDFSRIKAVRSLSSKYRTDNNIGVNSSLSEIEKHFTLEKLGLFNKEKETYILYTSEDGIIFEIGENQKCHGIVLTEKDKNATQSYLTFYPDFQKEE